MAASRRTSPPRSAPRADRATMAFRRPDLDPERPVYVISVAASIVSVHPRTLRIYEEEGLICPARTPTNIRLYSEQDVRRVMWIRHLTQNLGVNLAGVRILFELEERLGTRILERLYSEATYREDRADLHQLYGVGTVAKIAQVGQLQDGTVRAIIQGQARMRLHGFAQTEPFIRARIEELSEQPSTDVEVQALMRSVQAQVEPYV